MALREMRAAPALPRDTRNPGLAAHSEQASAEPPRQGVPAVTSRKATQPLPRFAQLRATPGMPRGLARASRPPCLGAPERTLWDDRGGEAAPSPREPRGRGEAPGGLRLRPPPRGAQARGAAPLPCGPCAGCPRSPQSSQSRGDGRGKRFSRCPASGGAITK